MSSCLSSFLSWCCSSFRSRPNAVVLQFGMAAVATSLKQHHDQHNTYTIIQLHMSRLLLAPLASCHEPSICRRQPASQGSAFCAECACLQLLFARPVTQLEQATFVASTLSVNTPDFFSTCIRPGATNDLNVCHWWHVASPLSQSRVTHYTGLNTP